MKTDLIDCSGEVEWFCVGERFTIDEEYRALHDLIVISFHDVETLAGMLHERPINEAVQVPFLRTMLDSLDYRYEQLYISDAGGNYFNADGQKNNISDRVYFHEVMEGRTVISQPIINRSTKNPIVAVATPIIQKGRVIGLFGVTILIGSCFRGLRYLPLGFDGKRVRQKQKGRKRAKSGTMKCRFLNVA
jgi:hypothetical protein